MYQTREEQDLKRENTPEFAEGGASHLAQESPATINISAPHAPKEG